MGLISSKSAKESESSGSKFIRGMETVEKLGVLGLIIFIVYEFFKFDSTDAGKTFKQMFDSVGGFMYWLSTHPNLLVAGFFTYLLAPIAEIVIGSMASFFIGRSKAGRQMRIKAEGELFSDYIKREYPNMTIEEARAKQSAMIEKYYEKGMAAVDAKLTQEQSQSGKSVSQTQAESNANVASAAAEPDPDVNDTDDNEVDNEVEKVKID